MGTTTSFIDPDFAVHNHQAAVDGQEEDGLGHYHDGVKRILTVEQVAIFRHSEIQSLLREQKRQREMESQEDIGSVKTDKKIDIFEGKLVGDLDRMGVVETQEKDDEEEYVRFLEAEQDEIVATAARHKRKKSCELVSGCNGKASTRRIVRELDSAFGGEEVLDYGDEPPAKFARPMVDKTPRRNLNRRIQITYDDDHSEVSLNANVDDHEFDRGSDKGRKIWWPAIKK